MLLFHWLADGLLLLLANPILQKYRSPVRKNLGNAELWYSLNRKFKRNTKEFIKKPYKKIYCNIHSLTLQYSR